MGTMTDVLPESESRLAASEQVKLCKHCKWCKPDRSWWWFCLILPAAPFFAYGAMSEQWRYSTCRRAKRGLTSYELTGARQPASTAFCSVERQFSCGYDAKFFEPKD